MSEVDELTQIARIKDSDLSPFSFQGMRLPCKVVSCHDGDTVRVAAKVPWTTKPVKLTVRLAGINAPEVNPPAFAWNREGIKKRAYLARNALLQLTTNVRFDCSNTSLTDAQVQEIVDANTQILEIECKQNDAFGRVLGTLFVNGENVNEIMVLAGHADRFEK
eukprot:jgi/Mesvir1/7788/Mv11731-RA.1